MLGSTSGECSVCAGGCHQEAAGQAGTRCVVYDTRVMSLRSEETVYVALGDHGMWANTTCTGSYAVSSRSQGAHCGYGSSDPARHQLVQNSAHSAHLDVVTTTSLLAVHQRSQGCAERVAEGRCESLSVCYHRAGDGYTGRTVCKPEELAHCY